MSQPPITREQLAALPPEFRALLEAVIDYYEKRIAALEAQVAELKARLNKDSTNSSLPPSASHPHAKPAPRQAPSGRQSGGQPFTGRNPAFLRRNYDKGMSIASL